MCLHSIDFFSCGCKKSAAVHEKYCASYDRYLDQVYDYDRRAGPHDRKYPVRKCPHLHYIKYVVDVPCRSHRRQTELDRQIAALERDIDRLQKLIGEEKKKREREDGHGKDRRGRRRERSPL